MPIVIVKVNAERSHRSGPLVRGPSRSLSVEVHAQLAEPIELPRGQEESYSSEVESAGDLIARVITETAYECGLEARSAEVVQMSKAELAERREEEPAGIDRDMER